MTRVSLRPAGAGHMPQVGTASQYEAWWSHHHCGTQRVPVVRRVRSSHCICRQGGSQGR
nr:MAG TPA: antitoxin [Caudoviricetes sp.]